MRILQKLIDVIRCLFSTKKINTKKKKSIGSSRHRNEIVRRIRLEVNFADVVSDYLDIEESGSHFFARCPKQEESRTGLARSPWQKKTRPALVIHPQRNSWYCFHCDIGGDSIAFVMEYAQVGFRHAVGLLSLRLTDDSEGENVSTLTKRKKSAMQRDMDRIRSLLLYIEQNEKLPGQEGDFNKVVVQHIHLLYEIGLIDGVFRSDTRGPTYFLDCNTRLTWRGYEFLDTVRDDDIWEQTKESISKKVGTASFEMTINVAKEFAMQKLGLNN